MSAPTSRITYLEDQLEVTRRELKNLRQQLKSLQYVHQKECDKINEQLENFQCATCKNLQKEKTPTEDALNTHSRDMTVPLQQIGTVYTDFPEKRGTPRQAVICSDAVAKLVLNNDIFTNPTHSLEGLQEFSHMWILFHFHKVDAAHVKAKVSPPRLNGVKAGVFGTRSPHRPSPIGLSLVKINEIRGSTIYFSGVDMIDGTPVIDIKPFIPHYDSPTMLKSSNLNKTAVLHTDASCSASKEADRGDFSARDVSVENLHSVSSPSRNELFLTQLTRVRNSIVPTLIFNAKYRAQNTVYTTKKLYATNTGLGEREAPDGEEGEPPDLATTSTKPPSNIEVVNVESPEECVRVPSWIHDSPVTPLDVCFEEEAEFQLSQLGPEGEAKKNVILNVLIQDPRSVYLRERWESQPYVFKISDLHVYCKFDDANHKVTVNKVFSPFEPELTN